MSFDYDGIYDDNTRLCITKLLCESPLQMCSLINNEMFPRYYMHSYIRTAAEIDTRNKLDPIEVMQLSKTKCFILLNLISEI